MVIISANNFNSTGIDPQIINQLTAESFGHSFINPVVERAMNEFNSFIGFIKEDNIVVGAGFAKEDSHRDYKYKTMFLHSFSTRRDYQGRGICKQLVNEFVKKFGKSHLLYLQVRINPDNMNEGAIRCYERNDFLLIPQAINPSHGDGLNSFMVRIPTISRRKSKRRSKPNQSRRRKRR